MKRSLKEKAIRRTIEKQGDRVPILLGGQLLTVTRAHADALAAAGVQFAYLCIHRGRFVTVPVN